VTGFDFVALTILIASSLLGAVRGLVKETLSLAAYALAFVMAILWGPMVYDWLSSVIEFTLLRMALAYGSVFIVVLIVVGLVSMTIGAILRQTGLTSTDRGLGALFGFLRGLLIILALVALAGYTPLPQEPWWRDSLFADSTVRAILHLKNWLPASVADWLPYPQPVVPAQTEI